MTAPNPTIIHIPAGVGIDQSVREEHVPPGSGNLYAGNVRVDDQGSLIKRPGYGSLTTDRLGPGSPPGISAGLRIAPFKDSVVMTDGAILSSYVESLQQWAPKGRLPECSARTTAVRTTGMGSVVQSSSSAMDLAYDNGLYAIASIEPDDEFTAIINVSLVDSATRKLVMSFNLTAGATVAATNVKVVVVSGYLVVIWNDSGNIVGRAVNLASPTSFGAPVTISSNGNLTYLDVHALSDRVAVAYENSGGGTTRISVKTLTPSTLATISSVTQTTASGTLNGIALAGSEELWVLWSYTDADQKLWSAIRATSDLSVVSVATAVVDFAGQAINAPSGIAAGRSAASTIYAGAWAADSTDSSFVFSRIIQLTNSAGTIVAGHQTTYVGGWFPISKPFAVNGRVLMEMAYDDSTTTLDVVLADVTSDASVSGYDRNQTLRPVAWVSPRANIGPLGGVVSPRHIVVTPTKYASVHMVEVSAVSASHNIAEYDFVSNLKQIPTVYAGQLHFAGGLHYAFDGERCVEHGFIVPPKITANVSSGTGLTGTFSYTAIDEFTDAAGNITWGPPAPVQTVSPSNKDVIIHARRPSMTWKEGYDSATYLQPQGGRRAKTHIFRTLDGGGVFYKLHTFNSNPLDGIQIYTDNLSDDTLQGNAKLYKSPGTVGTAKDRQAIGACTQFVECNGVLVAAMEDGTTLRCFAQRTVGESPWHHDDLQTPLEGDGPITGMASMDGAVVVFKSDTIFVVPVDPANDNISIGGFGAPRRIAADAGCINPLSLVVTGAGIFFQSAQGIEILTRQLDVVFVGKKIQRTFADYQNVTAAVLDVRSALVRFSLAQDDSTTVGVDAVFDISLNEWVSFDDKRSATGSALSQAVSAAYCNSINGYRYYWLESSGVVHRELLTTGTDAWLDDGAWVTTTWETPWLKLELQREHQMWQALVLFERGGSGGLVAEVAFDWADYESGDNKVWSEAEMDANPHQVEARITGRRQSVKFRFHDTIVSVPENPGHGVEYIGLSLDLAPHQGATQGTPKLPVGARK